MELNRVGKEYYTLELAATEIDGTPVVNPTYAASFDEGATWENGTKDSATGWWQWLVAGPLADPAGAVAVIAGPWCNPIVRLVDNPEVVARDMPVINVKV